MRTHPLSPVVSLFCSCSARFMVLSPCGQQVLSVAGVMVSKAAFCLRSTSPLTLLGAGMQTGDNEEFHTREETWRRSGGEVSCCRHGVSRERTSELRPGCTGVTTQGCGKKRDRWGQQVCLQKGKKAGVGNGWRQVWLNSVAGIARESR